MSSISMGLRDFMAAAAMPGLLSRTDIKREESGEQFLNMAKISYTIADLMILVSEGENDER